MKLKPAAGVYGQGFPGGPPRASTSTGPLGWKVFLQYMAAAMRVMKENTTYTERQCQTCAYGHDCCMLSVWITPFEAIGIAWYVNQKTHFNADHIKQAIRLRAREYRDMSAGKDGQSADDRWFRIAKKPCVFYDADRRRCSIYKARPLACRGVYSVWDCSKQVWTAPTAAPRTKARIIELVTKAPGSTYPENIMEMCNMLEYMMDNPEKVVFSSGPRDSLFGMMKRVRFVGKISDKELLLGADPSPTGLHLPQPPEPTLPPAP